MPDTNETRGKRIKVSARHRDALERLRPYLWSPHQAEAFLRDLAELFPEAQRSEFANAALQPQLTAANQKLAEAEKRVRELEARTSEQPTR